MCRRQPAAMVQVSTSCHTLHGDAPPAGCDGAATVQGLPNNRSVWGFETQSRHSTRALAVQVGRLVSKVHRADSAAHTHMHLPQPAPRTHDCATSLSSSASSPLDHSSQVKPLHQESQKPKVSRSSHISPGVWSACDVLELPSLRTLCSHPGCKDHPEGPARPWPSRLDVRSRKACQGKGAIHGLGRAAMMKYRAELSWKGRGEGARRG